MKRSIKNENGYTLLLTVGIIVIFTVLGLCLLTLTSNGIKKNENRQNTVQAQDLSDKGIKYAVDDLQKYLENQIKNNPMGKTQFYNLLDNTIKVNCPDGIEIPGEKASQTKVCIDHVEMISNEEKDRYKRLVTFKSTGLVNGKTHTTTSKVIIGTDSIPDQLRYALSTNDGGDLYLHGGVEIQGDIKTDGNLIITKKAFWDYPETPRWEISVGPRLIKDTKSITPKIIMNDSEKYIYLVNDNNNSYPDNDDIFTNKNDFLNRYTKVSPTEANAINILKANLFNTPNLNIVTRSLPADRVDISAKIQEQNESTVDYHFGELTINYPTKNFSHSDAILVKKKCKDSNRDGTCKKYTGSGNMKIKDVNADLIGTYYVDGNLSIENTNLKSNALIYVNGDVNIQYSTLKGLDSDPNSTLIIFSKGNIQISNISENSYYDSPSKIKGFFYSKSNMIMYGVGSNIRLTGGISSKRLILTALRGNTTERRDWFGKLHLNVDSIDNQKDRDSRLKVTYDENLIRQYTSFLRDEKEEYITQLNDPEYIERSNN
ncbi:MAG: hypothetical protein ACI383_06495 [Rummeliibacillus sp.]